MCGTNTMRAFHSASVLRRSWSASCVVDCALHCQHCAWLYTARSRNDVFTNGFQCCQQVGCGSYQARVGLIDFMVVVPAFSDSLSVIGIINVNCVAFPPSTAPACVLVSLVTHLMVRHTIRVAKKQSTAMHLNGSAPSSSVKSISHS